MKTRLICIGFLLTMVCGCGTLSNTLPDISGKSPPPPRKVFGGVRSDAHSIGDLLTWEQGDSIIYEATQVVLVPLILLDIPFSVIGDTLTLGQTIPASRERRAQNKMGEENPLIDDDDDD